MASKRLSKPLEAEIERLWSLWQSASQSYGKPRWRNDMLKFARMVEEEKKTQIMRDLDGLERATRAKRPKAGDGHGEQQTVG